MKTKLILAIALLMLVKVSFAFADVKTESKAAVSHASDDHKDHDGAEEKEHAHNEEAAEENQNVGPDRGITAADEHEGIKLSAEATKNFDLKTIELSGAAPWEIPSSALLTSGEEINIYRVRSGFYKRIDFNLLSKTATHMKVTSKELMKGDAIVIHGIGFLRTAEITAFGGAPEGHSH